MARILLLAIEQLVTQFTRLAFRLQFMHSRQTRSLCGSAHQFAILELKAAILGVIVRRAVEVFRGSAGRRRANYFITCAREVSDSPLAFIGEVV